MDQKTSILIGRQVPEHIREDYPLFMTFLEAYYEFLENKQGTQKNDLTTKLKELRNISDVDDSIDEFEDQFLSTFASLFPVDASVDKAFLIKNILPLYQSKGSENSFKLLFRLLFAQQPEISYPRDRILRASDGKWKMETALKVLSGDISSFYVGDGTTTEFNLISPKPANLVRVYVDGVLQTSGFKVLEEYKLLIFDTAVADNSKIEVFYDYVNKAIFNNRKLTGTKSGASVLIEKVFSTIVDNEGIFELYVDVKTLEGEFTIGEDVETSVFVGNTPVNVRMRSLSKITDITVTDGGSNYNVGDPVIVVSPGAARLPTAFVSKTSKSTFDAVDIIEGGAGFAVGSNVTTGAYSEPFVDIEVNSVYLSSPNTANTFRVFTDIISDIDPANTTIAAMTYGLTGNLSGNLTSVISRCLANTQFAPIGEIIGLQINAVQVDFVNIPVLNVEPASIVITNTGYTATNTKVYIDSYGSLGKMVIYNGGQGYAVGEEITFTNQPGQFGTAAHAEVRGVDANGSITLVRFVPSKITGTANVFTSNVTVIGTGTSFQSELFVGNKIWINGEDRTVVEVISDTSMNVDSAFTTAVNGKPIRLYGKHPVGGFNYEQQYLPSLTINTVAGTGANVAVVAIMGDGENLQAVLGNNKPGAIETITVVDAGKSLVSVPEVDLTDYGDGTATAETSLIPSFVEFEGKWLKSDGIISNRNIKLQGLDYYLDYSYVISSTVQFKKYKTILKELIHPGGTIVYAEMSRLDNITPPQVTVVSEITQESV